MLRILSSEGMGDFAPIELANVSLPYIPRYLSIVEPYAMIVSDEGSGSRLHCVDINGHEQWSTVVPFAVRQPPIDGSDGRVYLAGDGLAAIENGQVLWSKPATETIRATAFVDGTLAITQVNTFRIIKRDGPNILTYYSRFNEPITTPPAITHDGAVWMASEKSLYVAR
jgi:outer membrane protein assembly factor BamB